jgi:hypothetical protein
MTEIPAFRTIHKYTHFLAIPKPTLLQGLSGWINAPFSLTLAPPIIHQPGDIKWLVVK